MSKSTWFKWMQICTFTVVVVLCSSLPGQLRVAAQDVGNREGSWVGGGGLGFTSSASSFSLGFELAYYLSHHVNLVPRLSVGLHSGYTYFFLMADVRYNFDIHKASLSALKPFAGMGAGVVHADADGGGSASSFAFELPFGLDYWLDPDIALGTEMQFIIPVDLGNDHFIFQWLVINGRISF